MKHMKLETKCNLLYAAFYLLFYPSVVMFSSYMMLLGSSSDKIAIFLSILGILTMISKPLFAVFVDKGNCKALSIILCSLVAIGTTIFFQSKQIGVIQSLIYIVLISMNTACIAEIIDSWTLKLSVEYPELDFAKHRSMGSLSYAIVSLIFGYSLSKLGIKLAPITIYVLLLVLILIILTIPNPSAKTQKKEKVKWNDIKSLLTNKQFLYFVIFFAMGCAMVDLADSYTGVLMLEKGGTTAHTGVYEFIKAGLEFIVMFGCTKLITKYGVKKILAISYFGVFIKNLLAAVCHNPTLLVITSVTQIIGFPLMMPAKMDMLKKLVEPKSLALAISISGVFTSLFVSLVCNPIISYTAPYIGTSGAIILTSFFGLISAIGTILLQKEV